MLSRPSDVHGTTSRVTHCGTLHRGNNLYITQHPSGTSTCFLMLLHPDMQVSYQLSQNPSLHHRNRAGRHTLISSHAQPAQMTHPPSHPLIAWVQEAPHSSTAAAPLSLQSTTKTEIRHEPPQCEREAFNILPLCLQPLLGIYAVDCPGSSHRTLMRMFCNTALGLSNQQASESDAHQVRQVLDLVDTSSPSLWQYAGLFAAHLSLSQSLHMSNGQLQQNTEDRAGAWRG